MTKCTCSLFNMCDACFKAEQKFIKFIIEDRAHTMKIFTGEIEPNCNECNDSGWVRCSCKNCTNG